MQLFSTLNKNKYRLCAGALALAMTLGLTGCTDPIQEGISTLLSPGETYEKRSAATSLYEVKDNDRLYADLEDGVITMYLTVGQGSGAEGTDHTWTEVNAYPLSYYDELGVEPYKCEALLQVGDEIGPLSGHFGYGELTANATVRLRGQGASEQAQKSYRIDIKSGKGTWEDQKVVVLNKHAADPTKFRNKLAYDLMAEIPAMFSARTWFVHLYVKDRTEGENGQFEDYGLYTAVEQINKRYLKNRGLDSGGNLYKAGTFDWQRHADGLTLATSPDYDPAAFEALLEVEGDVDHTKLLELLDAVNDESRPIWDVVRKYFSQDNLFYWLAFHILMGDRDAALSNYYLYSPQGSDVWYILSWDNDGILSDAYEQLRDPDYDPSWSHGIFPFVGAKLYERMLKDSQCREALDAAVEDLMSGWLSEDGIDQRAAHYADLIKDLIYHIPDEMYQRVSSTNYERLAAAMADEIGDNYEAYKASLDEPWPFHILAPEAGDDTLTFRWGSSYLYSGDAPIYAVELSRDPNFRDTLAEEELEETELEIDALDQGQYFLRVRAGDGQGRWQDACEYYLTETDRTIHGTLCFYVLADGSVQVNEYIEE